MLEIGSAISDNLVLTVLHSGMDTRVTWRYGKKAVDGATNSTEAAEELTKLLTVSIPLAIFKKGHCST